MKKSSGASHQMREMNNSGSTPDQKGSKRNLGWSKMIRVSSSPISEVEKTRVKRDSMSTMKGK
jgi:hypothetical protein